MSRCNYYALIVLVGRRLSPCRRKGSRRRRRRRGEEEEVHSKRAQ
jgi:hypothetical protein